jgi:hypothetical protein
MNVANLVLLSACLTAAGRSAHNSAPANFGKAKSLIFNVERENGAWKISDITGDDDKLPNAFEDAAKG